MDMTTTAIAPSARIASTRANDPQFMILTAALRKQACHCNDCGAYIVRGSVNSACVAASSATLLALAKRSLVVLDKCGGRIVGAYVTDLGRRTQRQMAERMAWDERTARIVAGR